VQRFCGDWSLGRWLGGSIPCGRNTSLGTWIRCLDNPPKTNFGSPIFKLLLATKPIINEKLNWIPGNGRWIRPWGDKIMESIVLNNWIHCSLFVIGWRFKVSQLS
jgi:hypothetical protein